MQSSAMHYSRCFNVHRNSTAGSQLLRGSPRLPRRAAAITQAGLFGLNFGTASGTDVKTQKQEVQTQRLHARLTYTANGLYMLQC